MTWPQKIKSLNSLYTIQRGGISYEMPRFFIASNYSWRCHQSQLSKRNQQPQHNKYNRKNKTAPKVGVIMIVIILQEL